MVHEKRIRRGLWPTAVAKKANPGRDAKVRTVEIKTKDTVLSRPVVNISLLEECER